MAIDIATFTTQFPEFAQTATTLQGQNLIQAKLNAAMQHVDAVLWGARYENGVFLKAAHMLALSPFGGNARLSKNSAETLYSVLFDQEISALPVRTLVPGA